jgi:TfoX/Sxy family transcriptional regulator of competence genes
MSYNENLAERIRKALAHLGNVKEKKMFGGLAFMVDDKMCITAGDNRIMCRVDPILHEDLIHNKGCRTVIMRGREYKGYIHVDEESINSKKDFDHWIALALDFNKRAKSSKK